MSDAGVGIYLSILKSFGAAHADAQWARWKTVVFLSVYDLRELDVINVRRTFFNAVLVGLAIVLLLLLGHSLDAVVVVVLVWCALL